MTRDLRFATTGCWILLPRKRDFTPNLTIFGSSSGVPEKQKGIWSMDHILFSFWNPPRIVVFHHESSSMGHGLSFSAMSRQAFTDVPTMPHILAPGIYFQAKWIDIFQLVSIKRNKSTLLKTSPWKAIIIPLIPEIHWFEYFQKKLIISLLSAHGLIIV